MSKWTLLASDVERDNENGLVDSVRLEYQEDNGKYEIFACYKGGKFEKIHTANYPHRPKVFKRLTTVPAYVTGMGIKRFEVVYPEVCSQVKF